MVEECNICGKDFFLTSNRKTCSDKCEEIEKKALGVFFTELTSFRNMNVFIGVDFIKNHIFNLLLFVGNNNKQKDIIINKKIL